MALTVTYGNANPSTTNNTTVATAAASITAAVGDVLLIMVAAANAGTNGAAPTVTLADNAGGSTNVYTQRGSTGNATNGTASDGASQYFFECPVTTALSGAVITATFNVNVPQKTIAVYILSPGSGEVVSFVGVGTPQVTTPDTGTTTHSAATVSVENGHTIFGHAAIETDDVPTGDADTTNGSWNNLTGTVADGGVDAVSMQTYQQYKTVNATGNQSWACTTSNARDSARNYIIYKSGRVLAAAVGSFVLNGQAAVLKRGYVVTAAAASFILSGQAAILRRGLKIVSAVGSFILSGQTALLRRGYPLVAAVGSFILGGQTAILRRGLKVVAAAASFILSGQNAGLLKGRPFAAALGTFLFTGKDATLTYVPNVGSTYTLVADAAAYILGGQAALLKRGLLISAAAGSFLLVGKAATLLRNARLTIGAGVFTLSGQAAALRPDRRIIAAKATFTLSGQIAILQKRITLTAVKGTFTLTGQTSVLRAIRKIFAAVGSFLFTGKSALLTYNPLVITEVFSPGEVGGIGTLQIPQLEAYENTEDWAKTLSTVLTELLKILQDPAVAPPYEVAYLPDPAKSHYNLITVVDEVGGETIAYSDKTNWRRVQDGAIVS